MVETMQQTATPVENNHWIRKTHHRLSRFVRTERDRWARRADDIGEADHARLGDAVLRDAIRERASDIHLEPQHNGVRLRFRVDGVLMDTELLTTEQGQHLIRHFKVLSGLDPIATFRPHDARTTVDVDGEPVDIRLASAPCVFGEKLALRLLDQRRVKQRIDELGLGGSARDAIRSWLDSMSGMFLVCGPTGSGKTTTLYALLHELRVAERSVVTIEDPVEYQLEGITQMHVDHRHGVEFATGLRAMLRLDPDYLLLGEIRDEGSAEAALEAATSGCVLLSTLHSRNAVNVITALRNWKLADHELAATLEVVVAQRLVRQLCTECRVQRAPDDVERAWFESLNQPVPDAVWHAPGCDACAHLGYRGRTGLFEVWRLSEDDKQLIAEHGDERALRERLRSRSDGSLIDDGLQKVADGETSVAEVRAHSGIMV
ncbi:MAG TPA: GspE/PulE family protein [Phycisphaerae bacterium]|nr:GspE/PulE family protein [Phycisphaerae bacterium]